MVLNQGYHDNRHYNNEDDVNMAEKVPIDNVMKIHDELIEGLEQGAFITGQEIMFVYKIKERLLRQKLISKAHDSGENILKSHPTECLLLLKRPTSWSLAFFLYFSSLDRKT